MNSIVSVLQRYALLVLAAAGALVPRPAAAELLTLEQAVGRALQNNPGIRAAEAQVDAAQAGVLRSSSGFLPKVTLSETWSRTDNPMMVLGTKLNQEIVAPADFAPSVMNDPEALSNYNTRMAVMQPLFNGGKEYLGVTQSKLARDAAVKDRERTRQETVFQVVKAYYSVLLSKEYHAVATRSLETSTENVRLTETRYRAGAVLQSDLLRARVQAAEVREMVTRAESGIKLAKANLAYAMGTPQQDDIEIDGTLAPREPSKELVAATGEALAGRPDLAALDLNRKNAEAGVRQARTDYLPTVNLMGQMDWNSDRFAGNDARSWAVMAVVSWNIFDGMATTANVRQAAAAAGRVRAMEEQMRSAVELQVKQSYYSLQASRDRIEATATSVQEAEEGLRIVQKRYESGMTTFVDVLGAESALIRARTSALQALFDNNVADAELRLATGAL